jgi:hypothetical protein
MDLRNEILTMDDLKVGLKTSTIAAAGVHFATLLQSMVAIATMRRSRFAMAIARAENGGTLRIQKFVEKDGAGPCAAGNEPAAMFENHPFPGGQGTTRRISRRRWLPFLSLTESPGPTASVGVSALADEPQRRAPSRGRRERRGADRGARANWGRARPARRAIRYRREYVAAGPARSGPPGQTVVRR